MEGFHDALLWMLPLAVALELGVAWPCRLPHPVRLIGLWLNVLEPRLRALAPHLERTEGYLPDVVCSGLARAGLLGVLLTVGLTGGVAAALCALPLAGWLASLVLCWAGLALGSLLRAGREAVAVLERANVGERLAPADLAEARRMVGGLVSRDLAKADEADIARALAESLAENFNDAFVAPLFWLTCGGPVGLWVYKAVSTMDSMWGYRTEQWEMLGKAAARLDDVLAFVPARLAALLLWAVSPRGESAHGGRWPGWGVVRRQAARMASPNAGWPMAAAAWLHGAAMGGPTVYHGEVVDKPRLGPEPDVSSAPFPPAFPEDAGASPVGEDLFWTPSRLHALMGRLLLAGLAGTGLAWVFLWGLWI